MNWEEEEEEKRFHENWMNRSEILKRKNREEKEKMGPVLAQMIKEKIGLIVSPDWPAIYLKVKDSFVCFEIERSDYNLPFRMVLSISVRCFDCEKYFNTQKCENKESLDEYIELVNEFSCKICTASRTLPPRPFGVREPYLHPLPKATVCEGLRLWPSTDY